MNPHNQSRYCTKIQLFSVALICELISLLMVFMFTHYHPVNTPLATVDITGIINQFVKTESAQSDSPTQHQKRIHAFSAQLEATLQTVAHEKHVILVPKEAVITGSLDFTTEVAERLSLLPSSVVLSDEKADAPQ